MVVKTPVTTYHGRRLLYGLLLASLMDTSGALTYGDDSMNRVYGTEPRIYERGPQKTPVPLRKPPTASPSPSDRERARKPTTPAHDVKVERPQAVQPSKAIESTSLLQSGPTVAEVVTPTGPLVVGRVTYHGPVPAPLQIQVDRDNEVCGQTKTVTQLAVDAVSHGVRDAIVHVGVGQEMVDNSPVKVSVIQNDHCAFFPRVAAVLAGSESEIRNNDPVMHNTNMALNNRTVLNVALVAGGTPIRKPLKKEGLHIIKCNVHKFMQAFRYVFSDPYFDQTNDVGQFHIQGLPPGLHAISVWHETLGVLHKEVEVPTRGTVTVDFEYK